MALPRLPTLQEVWDDPSILLGLPVPIAQEFLERLRLVEQAVGGSVDIAPDPVSLAISHPRYRWMDTQHLHYLGERVADTIDQHGAVMALMPPRHAKTTTCSMWTPFWFLARHPEENVMYISYEANFARKWGIKTRTLIELYGKPYGLEINPKKTAGDEWELTTGGGMKSVGWGGGVSGNPVKLLICDDLLKSSEEAASATIRNKIWDWLEGTAFQRIEPDTSTIFIGTLYHEDDHLSRIIKFSESGDGMTVEVVRLRAKAEEDDPLGREIGEGLWTNHPLAAGGTWGQEFYDKKEATLAPYIWSSTYQQRATPPSGNMVDPEWWHFYKPSELPSDFDQGAQSWDLALDAQSKGDSYHCGLVGYRKGALVFVRDGYHKHSQIDSGPDKEADPSVISTLKTWNLLYPQARYKLIERSLAGPMLIQTLQHKVGGMLPWPPKGTQKGSKEACLNACVPDIRSGNVLLPLNPDGTKPKWVLELIEECRQFPRAPNDDWVDCLSQLLSFLLPSIQRAQKEEEEQRALNAQGQPKSAQELHTQAVHQAITRLAEKKLGPLRKQQARMDRVAAQGGIALPLSRTSGGLLLPRGLGSLSRKTRGMW